MYNNVSEEPRALSLQEMEEVNGGGCNKRTQVLASSLGLAAGIASMFGPVGLAIAGPSAVGLGIVSLICAAQG